MKAREFRTSVIQRQRGRIGYPNIHGRIRLPCRGDHVRRNINTNDPMPELFQMPRQPALATAYVDRQSPRRRKKIKELVAMISPIAVMPRSPGPVDLLLRLGLPIVGGVHKGPLARRPQASER
jgi:hypothetical protein